MRFEDATEGGCLKGDPILRKCVPPPATEGESVRNLLGKRTKIWAGDQILTISLPNIFTDKVNFHLRTVRTASRPRGRSEKNKHCTGCQYY